MRIKITAKHDPETVRLLVSFAAAAIRAPHSGWSVWVKNSSGKARGTCYYDRRHITIGIGPASEFPCPNWRSRQKTVYADWREALIDIAAHEFGHAKMYYEKRRQSETEANWYGWHALSTYREGQVQP